MSENTTDGSTLHLLPADAYPGLVLGWCGPVVFRAGGHVPGVVVKTGEHKGIADVPWVWWEPRNDPNGIGKPSMLNSILLDLHRPECIDRVIRVLKAGVACVCQRAYTGPVTDSGLDAPDGAVLPGAERVGDRWEPRPCSDCNGTGYSIAPADLSWTRGLPAWQAGAILAATVLRVAAGEAAIDDLFEVPPGSSFDEDYCLDLERGGTIDFRSYILVPLTGGKVARVKAP